MARAKGAGRKPKPSKIKKLEGNPGGRKLNEKEPDPKKELIPCPDYLDGLARDEWARITPKLYRLGLLTEIDGVALAAYCQNFAIWVEASKQVKDKGYIVMVNGYPQANPYLSTAQRALKEMKSFMTEFGMTPSSRSRITVAPVGGVGNPAPTEDGEDAPPDWNGMLSQATVDQQPN